MVASNEQGGLKKAINGSSKRKFEEVEIRKLSEWDEWGNNYALFCGPHDGYEILAELGKSKEFELYEENIFLIELKSKELGKLLLVLANKGIRFIFS